MRPPFADCLFCEGGGGENDDDDTDDDAGVWNASDGGANSSLNSEAGGGWKSGLLDMNELKNLNTPEINSLTRDPGSFIHSNHVVLPTR